MPPNADRLISAMKQFAPLVEIDVRADPTHVYGRFRGAPNRQLAQQIQGDWLPEPVRITADGIHVQITTNLQSGERLVSAFQS